MQIEKDEVEILSGVRFGKTMGGPVALLLRNRDWVNWREKMAQSGDGEGIPKLDTARPGHADLPGILKFGHGDVRDVLERASARETAARVMAGGLAKAILRELGVDIVGHVLSIGKYRVSAGIEGNSVAAARAEGSPLRMADPEVEAKVKRWIDGLKEAGTTAGGVVACFLAPTHAAQIRVVLEQLRPGQAIIAIVPNPEPKNTPASASTPFAIFASASARRAAITPCGSPMRAASRRCASWTASTGSSKRRWTPTASRLRRRLASSRRWRTTDWATRRR
jgi:hypothetical protein